MRPYVASDEHPAFIYDRHHRSWHSRMRRAHRIPRDQTMRRYERKGARAEAREECRAALLEAIVAREQEAGDVAEACGPDCTCFDWDEPRGRTLDFAMLDEINFMDSLEYDGYEPAWDDYREDFGRGWVHEPSPMEVELDLAYGKYGYHSSDTQWDKLSDRLWRGHEDAA